MKKFLLLSGFILLTVVFANAQVKKILFLGNSYTGVNNLPEKVSMLASSLGDSVWYDSNTPGGYRLMNHATNPVTLQKIRQHDWDFVVIQAQSQEPSFPPQQVADEVLPYAAILNDSIKSNNPCSETVFFMTWGRKYGDYQNCPTWPPVCTFLGMQERLVAGYMTMAEQNSSTVAPVGLAWKHTMDNEPDSLIDLYTGDYSHPSPAGTYLTACVMYATMFHRSPVGASYHAGLPDYEASFLQQMATEVVLGEEYNFVFNDPHTGINYDLWWNDWFDFGNIAVAGFTYEGQDREFTFTDQSLNATEFYWEFGDGGTSVQQHPTHNYAQSGNYLVIHSVQNLCFEDTSMDTVNVVFTSLDELNSRTTISISPNPGKGIFKINIEDAANNSCSYEIFEVNGRMLGSGTLSGENGAFSGSIDLSACNKGLYYIRFSFGKETINKAIIIQ